MKPRSPLEAARSRLGQMVRIAERFYRASGLVPQEIRDSVRPIEGLQRVPPEEVGAEDGGSLFEELEAYTVYAVKAWSASYKLDASPTRLAEERLADAGIVVPYMYAEERIRIYRETLEAKASREAVRAMSGGVFLWDGSLRPLIRGRQPPPPLGARYATLDLEAAERLKKSIEKTGDADQEQKQKKDIVTKLRKMLAEKTEESPLAVRDWVLDVLGPDGLRDEDARWLGYLEWVEKLHAVRLFLEEAWSRGVMTIFITKTSRSSILAKRALPDVYYLRRAVPREPFYTRPIPRRGVKDLFPGGSDPVPPHPGLLSFYYEDLSVIEFYARLAPGKPILKIDVALPRGELDRLGVEAVQEQALRYLLGLDGGQGYPWLLGRAHREARLSRRELDQVVRLLRLELERSGRSMLE